MTPLRSLVQNHTNPKSRNSLGRWLFLAIVAFYLFIWAVLNLWVERTTAWKILGVPALSPSFADTRFIFSTLETHRSGVDPMKENRFDPWERRLNYPRVWLSLSVLGLTQANTDTAGIGLGVLFLTSLFYWLRDLDVATCLTVALFVCSYPVMLAIERGNVDLIIFSILAIVLGFIDRKPTMRPVLYFSILLVAVLKLYPISGVLVVLGEKPRRAITWLLVLLILFTLYLVIIYRDLKDIINNTTKSVDYSFGLLVLLKMTNSYVMLCLMLFNIGLIMSIFAFFRCLPGRLPLWQSPNTIYQDSFALGCGLYIGIFLLGYNYDYKLMFLILLVPQLIQWLQSGEEFARRTAPFLCVVLLSVLGEFPLRIIFPLEAMLLQETANWLTFVLSVYCVSSSTYAVFLHRSAGGP